jgi:hypothetical protein
MCTFNLRTELAPTADTGGSWTYNGYNSSSFNGPFNQSPGTPLFPGVGDGQTIPGGDNPSVDSTSVSTGFYSVTYNATATIPACNDSSDHVIHVQNTPCAGTNTSIDVCNDDPIVNLVTVINGASTCGTVDGYNLTNNDGSSGLSGTSYDPSADTPGTYTFTNTVTVNALPTYDIICAECTSTSLLTINNIEVERHN